MLGGGRRESYCPPIVLNNSLLPVIEAGSTETVKLNGYNLDQVSSVIATGSGNISVEIVNKTWQSVELKITSDDVIADHQIILKGECGDLTISDLLKVRDITKLLPGVNTNWVRQSSNIITGAQIITATSSPFGWDKGASFGTVPANTDCQLSFKLNVLTTGAAVIGLDQADPNHHYNTIDFALWINSGGRLWVYENGANKYLHSGIAVQDDTLQLRRTTNSISFHHNGNSAPFYVSPTSSTSQLVFDISINRNLSFSEVELWYAN